MMGENYDATQTLNPSAEEVFNGSLENIVWNDENNNSINNVGEYLESKTKVYLKEAISKYTPIGSVVKTQGRIGFYMIIGYKYNKNGTVFDYLAVKYPDGTTNNSQTYVFNHNEITKFFHIGMQDGIQKAYKEKLLKEDN